MARLHDKQDKLTLTDYLRFGPNSKIKVADGSGSDTEITLDELKNAVDSGTSAETLTAAKTLTADDSGKTFFLSAGTEFATTLPAVSAGLSFEFIVAAAPSGASYTIVTDSSSNVIVGHVVSSDLDAASDADSETSGGDTITFADGVAVVGDKVTLRCDGTNWFAAGSSKTYNAITITTAS